ncbi:MAG: hypothetical protein WC824_07040 [Bacteroidota bacterium]|jgi:hypothetical protein
MTEQIPSDDALSAISVEEFERRLRYARRVAIGMLIAVSASLAASYVVQPVSVMFLLAAFGLGIGWGGLIVFSTSVNSAWPGGLAGGLAGGLIVPALSFSQDFLLPEMRQNFFIGLWPGMSALLVGMTMIMLTMLRKSMQRKLSAVTRDQAAAAAFERNGDSKFTAQLRVSAEKTGRGQIYAFIVMAGVLGMFGLWVWITGFEVGVVLVIFVLPAIAFFFWQLHLQKGARALREKAGAS